MTLNKKMPDPSGHFGVYGGKFVPETIMPALIELEASYKRFSSDKKFKDQLKKLLTDYAGRPTPLYFCERLSKKYGFRVYLKREDLTHTGSHKINNTLGQVLLAKKMGKKRIIAETGAGQHGVATATVAALLDLDCVVYMGEEDVRRQALNVFKMRLLGAEVIPVKSGSRTLKDAINEAMRDWVTNIKTTYYVIGSVVGPHPYPVIVRDLQKIIGEELKVQSLKHEKKQPDYIIACVGGGSNSMGVFYPYLGTKTKLIGVEAAGHGTNTKKHGATLSKGTVGVLHGSKSYILQDNYGQIIETHSVSAGLDYPGVGPEHSYLKDNKLVEYVSVTDKEALDAFQELSRLEGIIPALESSHAVAYLKKLKAKKNAIVVVNLSGRGDKDVQQVAEILEGITI